MNVYQALYPGILIFLVIAGPGALAGIIFQPIGE